MEIGFHNGKLKDELQNKDTNNTQSLIENITHWFQSKSMFVVAYGTGCGAIEMPPTFTSRYDAERMGVTGVATPRQADILIVSGYLAFKTLRRVIRTYEQMQSPKYVIGLGSCAINGGMYWDSYNTMKKLDDYIPVDMLVNGCMPRPEALLEGFVKLQESIRTGKEAGWQKYDKDLAFYKENQKRALGGHIEPAYETNWYNLSGEGLA
jgi:NADH-quinone oxidoreductase subunit B